MVVLLLKDFSLSSTVLHIVLLRINILFGTAFLKYQFELGLCCRFFKCRKPIRMSLQCFLQVCFFNLNRRTDYKKKISINKKIMSRIANNNYMRSFKLRTRVPKWLIPEKKWCEILEEIPIAPSLLHPASLEIPKTKLTNFPSFSISLPKSSWILYKKVHLYGRHLY